MEYNWNLDPEDENVLIFDNDAQFYEFCVNPKLNIKSKKLKTGQNINYYDFDFTHDYNKALEAQNHFDYFGRYKRIVDSGYLNKELIV